MAGWLKWNTYLTHCHSQDPGFWQGDLESVPLTISVDCDDGADYCGEHGAKLSLRTTLLVYRA